MKYIKKYLELNEDIQDNITVGKLIIDDDDDFENINWNLELTLNNFNNLENNDALLKENLINLLISNKEKISNINEQIWNLLEIEINKLKNSDKTTSIYNKIYDRDRGTGRDRRSNHPA
jgi:hypothetical protein